MAPQHAHRANAQQGSSAAELDQIAAARQRGEMLHDGRPASSDGGAPEVPDTSGVPRRLSHGGSSNGASPAGNSSVSAADAFSALAPPPQQLPAQQPSLVVFSGGTAFNTVAGELALGACEQRRKLMLHNLIAAKMMMTFSRTSCACASSLAGLMMCLHTVISALGERRCFLQLQGTCGR